MYASKLPTGLRVPAAKVLDLKRERASGSAVAHWINDLVSADRATREQAREALVAQGADVLDALVTALNTREETVQWRLLPILAAIGGPTALRAVMTCLSSQNSAIRSAAADILGKARFMEALEPLLAQLKCRENGSSLVSIVQALGRLGDKRAVPALVAIMHETPVPSVRYTAIEALSKLGDRSLLPEIARYMNDPSHHVRDYAETAVRALSRSDAHSADVVLFKP